MAPSQMSIVIPTRHRPEYLEVTLESVSAQARSEDAELIVVDDGHDPATAAVTARHGARLQRTRHPGAGANAARNTGVETCAGELIVLIDDDVRAPEGWLRALRDGERRYPAYGVFGGPIHAELDGGGPHSCGREGAPITALDLGGKDRDAEAVWSANMAIRRSAFTQAGPFDETIRGRGEEEDWERRYVAAGGRIRYLAAAGLYHRRSRADARLERLMRAQFALGRTARRFDERRGDAPRAAAELTLVGRCVGHALRRRCAMGVVSAAHAAGRLQEALRT